MQIKFFLGMAMLALFASGFYMRQSCTGLYYQAMAPSFDNPSGVLVCTTDFGDSREI